MARIKTEKSVSAEDLIIGEPEELRPVELPLVVKLPDGKEWENTEQAAYAKTLNGYAYKNPKKWAAKKEALLARLVEIGKDPSLYRVYAAVPENLSYKNKLIEQ